MKKDIEVILAAMDSVEKQSPSPFFKQKVLRSYQLRKQMVLSKFEYWFPWFRTREQLVFTSLVVAINVVALITISNEVKYQKDIKTLSHEFNITK